MALPVFSARGYRKQGNQPKLLYKTVFGSGIALSAIDTLSPTNYWKYITSDDGLTGFTYAQFQALYGSGVTYGVQAIPQQAIADYNTYFTTQIQASTDSLSPAGGNELLLKCLLKDAVAGNPQTNLTITQDLAGVTAYPQLERCYVIRFYVPAGLTLPNNNDFWEVIEWKTGWGNEGAGALSRIGDLRHKLEIKNVSGTLGYHCQIDDNAGMAEGGASGTHLKYDGNLMGPVRKGCWHTCYFYFKRPSSTDSATNGVWQVLVIPDGYSPILCANIQPTDGITLRGAYNLEVNRMFCSLNYTNNTLPMESKISLLEIWNRSPINLV